MVKTQESTAGIDSTIAVTETERSPLLRKVLIYFSLTVNAATLIFISGRGSVISSVNQGKPGSIYNLVNNLFEPSKREQTCVHFMKILTVYTLNSHLFKTLKAHNHKMHVVFFHPPKYLQPHKQTV